MSGYSEDLRRRIVSSVGGGMSTRPRQSPHLLKVSLSSLKRYVNKAQRGEPLAPKKSPGSTPKLDEKATRLLAANLEERVPTSPFRNAATTWRPLRDSP
jgi:transposase